MPFNQTILDGKNANTGKDNYGYKEEGSKEKNTRKVKSPSPSNVACFHDEQATFYCKQFKSDISKDLCIKRQTIKDATNIIYGLEKIKDNARYPACGDCEQGNIILHSNPELLKRINDTPKSEFKQKRAWEEYKEKT